MNHAHGRQQEPDAIEPAGPGLVMAMEFSSHRNPHKARRFEKRGP
jgi:hypothetical protein